MPRGYLKKDTTVNRNIRRGGSSKKPQKGGGARRKNFKKSGASHAMRCSDKYEDWSYDYSEDRLGIMNDADDYWLPDPKCEYQEEEGEPPKAIDECGICYETKSVMHLGKFCNHAKACYDCFRQYYIVAAQKDITNYPLRCWHPACSFRKLHVDQVKKFARTPQELKRHYRLATLARARQDGKMVAHCPNCDHPHAFSNNNSNRVRVFVCLECTKTVAVLLHRTDRNLHNILFGGGRAAAKELCEIIQTLESLQADNMGGNDGWAVCPRCYMIISKGHGCNHMRCGACGSGFDWQRAKEAVKQIRRFAGCLITEPAHAP